MEQNMEDTFPQRFARVLFGRYPDWEQYWIPPNLDWQSEEDLAIEVPSRFAPVCPLRIDTMYDGIIISWVGWHIHCDDWGGNYTEKQFIEHALEVIAGLLNESWVVVIDWKDVPGGTGCLCESAKLDKQLQSGWWASIAKKRPVMAISWKGTHDRGHFDPAKCR